MVEDKLAVRDLPPNLIGAANGAANLDGEVGALARPDRIRDVVAGRFNRLKENLAYRRVRSRAATIVKSVLRNKRLYVIDLALAGLALVLAVVLRLGPSEVIATPEQVKALAFMTIAFGVICIVTFPVAGLYKRNWKYASILDYLILVRATFVASLILMACLFFYSRLAFVPRSTIAIEVMTLVSFLAATRLCFRQQDLKSLLPSFRSGAVLASDAQVPVLLVGAGDEADLYLRALQRDRTSSYLPVGFLDSASAEDGTMLRGVPVLGTMEDFEAVLADLETRGQRPRHLIFTAPLSSLDAAAAEKLIERADRRGLAVSRLNPVTELRNPRLTNEFELRPIELTDLLERPQIALDTEAMRRFIYGRSVLVTGAGGSIGSELTRQVAALGPSRLFVVDSCEFNLYSIDLELAERFPNLPRAAHLCDVRDPARVNELFGRHRPELVFHAAALKHVPMVELNPCEGALTNVCGTMNVAQAAKRWGALGMVQVSTDKVVNSTSVMGATKRLAELFCQALDLEGMREEGSPRFMTVRFGNVLGSSGSLIPLFKNQLARGGPLTVTHPEMKRFFMTIREAVELTLQASAYGLEKKLGQGEIFVLDMGEPIKIVDIARRMIRLAGYTPDQDVKIQIVGCRPGEKLFEELFDEAERRVTPPVPGVLGAVPTPVPLPVLRHAFGRLRHFAEQGDCEGLFGIIRGILPNFHAEKDPPGAAAELARVPAGSAAPHPDLVEIPPEIAALADALGAARAVVR
ncbi:capsular polysaccharide biosynthesis protein [Kaistia sp. 32K]|uniref:polysaccharide biosynthesis protein n=1 Tax=Kaistia sp. 32K TaxID=2795690 RepID=UPI00191617A4|nr:nucleoside-diphosphate sugar epimerase/dehydratase [Kaistia sp. 32K]BCP53906.1 capsular polysaccharide biosynthesis protein [Kaistia sp. 32K]